LEQVSAENVQLRHPVEENQLRDKFLSTARDSGFRAVFTLWRRTYKKEIRQAQLKSLVPYKVKAQLKNHYYAYKYRRR
jgi:hypothetical protein